MALNTSKCNRLTPLRFKGLKLLQIAEYCGPLWCATQW